MSSIPTVFLCGFVLTDGLPQTVNILQASGTDAWVKTGTKLTMLTLQYDGVNYNDIATDDGRLRLPMMPWGGGAYKQPLEKLLIDSPGQS